MSRAASLPPAAALKRLAVLWFVGAGLVFVLVFALGLTAESLIGGKVRRGKALTRSTAGRTHLGRLIALASMQVE